MTRAPTPANDNIPHQRPQWFDDLLSKYDPLIRKECGKRCGKIPFDDLYQETYLWLIRIWPQYRPGDEREFCTWVRLTIRSVVRDILRKNFPDVVFTNDVPELVVKPAQESAAEIEQIIGLCTRQQREAVELSAQGYDGSEIGKILGITRAAVSLRLIGARVKMRETANDNWNEDKKVA